MNEAVWSYEIDWSDTSIWITNGGKRVNHYSFYTFFEKEEEFGFEDWGMLDGAIKRDLLKQGVTSDSLNKYLKSIKKMGKFKDLLDI